MNRINRDNDSWGVGQRVKDTGVEGGAKMIGGGDKA